MKFTYSCEVTTSCSNMEKDLTAASTAAKHTKTSPLKEHISDQPQFTPVDVPAESFSLDSGPVGDKENKNTHTRELFVLDEVFHDSGYLSHYNSRNDAEHGSEEEQSTPTKPLQEKSRLQTCSPSKCSPSKTKMTVTPSCAVFTSTPKMCHWKKQSQKSTSALSQSNHNLLPIVKFQQAVCEELGKSFQKSKRYDWSVVDKIAEHHLLDRVIGRHMGREYVDVFSSLVSRNMKAMLAKILSLLGDTDLIRCRKVSRSWRKIINDDAAALNRCKRALEMLSKSRNSSGQENWCILTRDSGLSRVVLSSMQSLASSSPSTSTTPNHRAVRQTPSSQKSNTRISEYIQAASGLKQDESLRSCIRCGSPAKHLEQAQRATCTRASCGFEFCTCCQETFHGSTPCRMVTPRIGQHSKMSTLLPGSARSKRNVKRL